MAFPGNELLAAFDGGIKTIICKHSPGKPQPENRSPGIHQHREILFVLKGQSEFPLNHKLFTVKAGDVVLVDRWIAHCARYLPSDRNLVYLWFFLFPSRVMVLVHQVDAAGKVSYALKWVEIASALEPVISRRWDELNKLPPEKALENLELFLKEPLAMLLDELRFYLYMNRRKAEKIPRDRGIVNSIQRIIEAQNGRDCSLAQLEKFTGFNRFYISHLFKEAYHVSIGEYINRVRMKFYGSAREQGLNYKQIAFELGFKSTSSLSTWVRKNKAKCSVPDMG